MVSIEKRVTSGTSVTTAEEYVELLGFDEVLAIGAYYRRTERSPVGLAAYMTMPTTRARMEKKPAGTRHIPAIPTNTNPTTLKVCNAPN